MIITQMTADNLSILIDYYLSHTATCPPGSIYEECLIQCSQFCPPMANRPDLSARCEEDSCIPGCDDGTVTCDPPKMWLAPGVCVDETLCPCVDEDGSTVSVRGPPFNINGGGGDWSFCRGQIIYFNRARRRAENCTFYYMFI